MSGSCPAVLPYPPGVACELDAEHHGAHEGRAGATAWAWARCGQAQGRRS